MKVEFKITTANNIYKAKLKATDDEWALLNHLKHKLNREHDCANVEEEFKVELNII